MITFIELLNCNDEFVFYYNGIAYAIVMGEDGLPDGHELSLYLDDGYRGTFIKSFKDKDDFLQNGEIDGERIINIIDKIVI